MDYSMPDMNGIETVTHIISFFQQLGLDVHSREHMTPYICCLSAYTEESYK